MTNGRSYIYSQPEWVQFFTTCQRHGWSVASIPTYPPSYKQNHSFIQIYHISQPSMQEETQPCNVMREEEPDIQLHPPIVFSSKTFYFGHAMPQMIAMYFIDEAESMRFTCKQPLKKINLNTVIAALKASDCKTVSAKLKKEGKQECSLTIRVEEEYLLPIQEMLVFKGKRLSKEQKEQLATKKKGKGWIQHIKKQIVEYKGQCYKSGVTKKTGEPIFINIPLPYSTTLYSFDLYFKNMQENVVFLQLFYISGEGTREIQVMPKEGLFVMGQMNTCVLVQKKGHKEVMLKVTGRFDQAKYLVKMERVHSSQPYKVDRLKLIKWAKIGAYFMILLAISWKLLSRDEPTTVSTLQT